MCPVETRVQDIVLSMERWRWMPPDLGRNHLIVNIAGFELRRFADGRLEERMNVVVGRPYRKTPVFSDAIRYLEFNPYWNVPPGIAVKEELPKLKSNPAGARRGGLRGGARQHTSTRPRSTGASTGRATSLPAPSAAGAEQCARPGQVHVPQPV